MLTVIVPLWSSGGAWTAFKRQPRGIEVQPGFHHTQVRNMDPISSGYDDQIDKDCQTVNQTLGEITRTADIVKGCCLRISLSS